MPGCGPAGLASAHGTLPGPRPRASFTSLTSLLPSSEQLLTAQRVSCAHIYSALDQTARKINLARFTHGKCSALIVTDLAARGLDIPLLDNVINYSFPAKGKLFLHRVGEQRGTRPAGSRGVGMQPGRSCWAARLCFCRGHSPYPGLCLSLAVALDSMAFQSPRGPLPETPCPWLPQGPSLPVCPTQVLPALLGRDPGCLLSALPGTCSVNLSPGLCSTPAPPYLFVTKVIACPCAWVAVTEHQLSPGMEGPPFLHGLVLSS